MKKRRVMSMLLTAVLTGGSILSEYAYAAPGDADIAVEEEEATADEENAEAVNEENAKETDEEVSAAVSGNVSVSEDVADLEAIDYNNIESIRYGSYSTPVDGVVYLPDDVLSKMCEEELDVYVSYCDELAQIKQQYPEMEDMVIFTDEKGRLCYSYDIPAEVFNSISTVGFSGNVLMEPGEEDVDLIDDIEFIDEEDDDASVTGNMSIAGCNLEIADIDTDYDISDYEDIDLEDELRDHR